VFFHPDAGFAIDCAGFSEGNYPTRSSRSARSSNPQQAKDGPGLMMPTFAVVFGSAVGMVAARLFSGPGRTLDSGDAEGDNRRMVIQGRIQNGVVVLDGNSELPEGAVVAVVFPAQPPKPQAAEGTRVQFPLVRSAQPASIDLTNDRIAEILDEEDAAPRH
jgi:hypothetical protein